MACIGPDGKPTSSGIRTLQALISGPKSPDDIAERSTVPMYVIRSSLRELMGGGFVKLVGDKYELTDEGKQVLE